VVHICWLGRHATDSTAERSVNNGSVEDRPLWSADVSDFSQPALKPFAIAAIHPDEFFLDQLDLYPGVTMDVLRSPGRFLSASAEHMPEILVLLERTGVPRFAAEARRHLVHPTVFPSPRLALGAAL